MTNAPPPHDGQTVDTLEQARALAGQIVSVYDQRVLHVGPVTAWGLDERGPWVGIGRVEGPAIAPAIVVYLPARLRLRGARDSDVLPCPREASPATIRAAILEAARPYPELRDLRVEVMAPLATATMTACPVVCTREQPRKDRREGTVVIQTHDALRLSAQSLVGELARLWRYVAHTISCPVCAVLGSCGTCRGEGMSPEIAAPASVLQGEPQGLTGAGDRTPLPQGWTWDHQYPICASGPDRTFAMVRARDTHLGPAGSVYTALRTEAARLGLPWCGPEQTLGGAQ